MARVLTEQDWALRTAIYRHFVERARAPDPDEMAEMFDLSVELVRDAYLRLGRARAFLLEPGTTKIRMLNPFSAIETPYQVEIGDRRYCANCAWDMLAIPGMLGQDALVRGPLEVAGTIVEIPVRGGEPRPDRDYVVNYAVPFRNWYEDLIHT